MILRRFVWTHGQEIRVPEGDFLMFVVHWRTEWSDDGMFWAPINLFTRSAPAVEQ